MKKIYTAPEFSMIRLQAEDMITTSTGEFDGEWVGIGGESHAHD